ncbi:DUF819 domain-containing protein [Bowmanella denitrificans]|uniref:DUF819 family protein n=1 Tax=Bowmanella denitrificans TaxID=366582 RepID=UPI000C9C6885|nr:DUF819 family protein [Bowmanella denitrificans]
MIDSVSGFIALVLGCAGLLALLEDKTAKRFFALVPAVVVLYFVMLCAASLSVWQASPAIDQAYKVSKGNLLPAMIFLMMVQADLRIIAKLGPRLLLTFLAASASIILAIIVVHLLMHNWLPAQSWQTFAALAGSWLGGTGNMVAVQGIFSINEQSMGFALLVDSIDYAVWVFILLALTPHAKLFNRWSGADNTRLDQVAAQLNEQQIAPASGAALLFWLGAAAVAAQTAIWLGGILPGNEFFNSTAWQVVVATGLGLLVAQSRLRHLGGDRELSKLMLFILIALIASRGNVANIGQAPLFILSGLLILILHALVMLALAKLFRLDLFTCGVASLANIGGVASAPILAASYSRSLIPVGILMALLGYIVGTAGGILVGNLLPAI